jgi:hypothetical protein
LPEPSVIVERLARLDVETASTRTPGTATPCGSTTDPEILPVSAWANADRLIARRRAKKTTASPQGSPPSFVPFVLKCFVSFVVEKPFVPFVFRIRT